MEDVTWLPIDGCPGYEVSSDGRVRSVRYRTLKSNGRYHTRAGQVLKLRMSPDGYPKVRIYKGAYTVHRLVCIAFHGPQPDEDVEVRHLNGIKTDNRVANLAWGTRSENMRDNVRHGVNFLASRTHCNWGHPFNQENTRIVNGRRTCIECHRRSCREHYWRKKAAS